MIRWGKWSRKSDGEPMTCIYISHYLTRGDLACLLISATTPTTADQLRGMSRAEVEEAVRGQLRDNPARAYFWEDDYAEEYSREVTARQVLDWARKQVDKL